MIFTELDMMHRTAIPRRELSSQVRRRKMSRSNFLTSKLAIQLLRQQLKAAIGAIKQQVTQDDCLAQKATTSRKRVTHS